MNSSQNNQEIEKIVGIKVPLKKCASLIKKLGPLLFKGHNTPSVIQKEEKKNERIVLLNKSALDSKLTGLPEDIREWINSQSDLSITDYEPDNKTENKSICEILPENVDSNIKKELIKHIAILHLDDEQMPHKLEIAKNVLEKGKEITCVLSKTLKKSDENPINKFLHQYTFEVLQGFDSVLQFEENSCEYKLNLSQFYYDSSLQHERERIFTYLNKNDIICDLLASPLMSIQFLKRDFRIIVNNNWNFNSFKTIRENLALNKIDEKNILMLNINFIDFFKNIMVLPFKDSSDFFRIIYIDVFLKDLSLINIFYGITNICNAAENFKEDKAFLSIFFYYVLDIQSLKQKLKDHIINELNLNILNNLGKPSPLFETDDIEEICLLNYVLDKTTKVFMIKLRINHKILTADKALIYEILQCEKKNEVINIEEKKTSLKRRFEGDEVEVTNKKAH